MTDDEWVAHRIAVLRYRATHGADGRPLSPNTAHHAERKLRKRRAA